MEDDRAPSRGPNLLFVFPDEMRRQAVGCMDQDPAITPNLDRLAREGMLLTNAVSNVPLCSPYRGMLMTGKYPFSNGVPVNCNANPDSADSHLRQEERCFPDVLHGAGYSLGYVGKWHLERPYQPYVGVAEWGGPNDVWDEYTPPERRHGFDFWYSYGCQWEEAYAPQHYWTTGASRDEKTWIRQWDATHEADIAIEYLQNRDRKHRDSRRPFALFVSPYPPHSPFDAPDRYVEMYHDRSVADLLVRPNVGLSIDEGHTAEAKEVAKRYFAAVTGVDDQLGRILACLREEGLEENTVVVFTSDHGEMLGSHDLMGKEVWYEESIGVPFIIRWPGRIKPGSRDDVLLGAPDVMPSLLGLMGLGGQAPEGVQGQDYSGVFVGRPGARPTSALYLEIPEEHRQTRGRRGLRTMTHTFAIERHGGGQRVILHDNRKDPYQLRNVAEESPSLVQELTRALDDELARVGNDPWGAIGNW